jgi:hypothetical protein
VLAESPLVKAAIKDLLEKTFEACGAARSSYPGH